MSTITTYSFTSEGLLGNANQHREMMIDHLVMHGDITKEHGEKLKKTTLCVITKRGWFGKTWDKLFGKDLSQDDSIGMSIMRVVPASEAKTSG